MFCLNAYQFVKTLSVNIWEYLFIYLDTCIFLLKNPCHFVIFFLMGGGGVQHFYQILNKIQSSVYIS